MEIRNPKQIQMNEIWKRNRSRLSLVWSIAHFRLSCLFRISSFGFRISTDGGDWRVTLPLVPACRAGASLFCHAPPKEIYDLWFSIYDLAGCLGAAPSKRSFGGSAACWRATYLSGELRVESAECSRLWTIRTFKSEPNSLPCKWSNSVNDCQTTRPARS